MPTATEPHHGEPRPPREHHRNERGTPSKIDRLLAQRDRLADMAYEADAHCDGQGDRDGDSYDAWQLVGAAEDAIHDLSPNTYKKRVTTWADEDAQREHTPDDPRPATCRTCARSTSIAS